jgi:hypothetical protein
MSLSYAATIMGAKGRELIQLTKRFVGRAGPTPAAKHHSALFFDPGAHRPAHSVALFPGAKRCIQRVRIVRAGLTSQAPAI